MTLRFFEVFVPGGFPQYTYNPRVGLQLEEQLSEVKDNLCKLVTVTGHTKSGKTVLARKVLPPGDSIWVNGGAVSREDDFWHIIIDELDLHQQSTQDQKSETSVKAGGKAGGEIKILGVGPQAEISSEAGRSTSRGVTATQTLSTRVTALRGLKDAGRALVIDDFHYLDTELQGSIVRALKTLIFDGLPVVIIAIPHRRYDVVKIEREMTGRILNVEIPEWDFGDLKFIADTGFNLLNYDIGRRAASYLAHEAIGSPHLMQDFCRELCRIAQISSRSNIPIDLDLTDANAEDAFRNVANTIGRPVFDKLAQGPLTRSDRKVRPLKDGSEVDIYRLVLMALVRMRPGLVSVEYETLRSVIREIATQLPQINEISRVLEKMSDLAAKDDNSTPVIEFDKKERRLHITDPFFSFFLRWGDTH